MIFTLSRNKTAALILAAIMLCTTGCSSQKSKNIVSAEASQTAPASSAIEVKVTQATLGDVSRNTEFAGKIESDENVSVYPPAQAQVVATYFDEGQTVQKGDLLFEIDSEDLENDVEKAYLQYQSATSSSSNSLLNAERSWSSSANSYQTSKDNLDDLEDEYDDKLDALRDNRNEAQSNLSDARADLSSGIADGASEGEIAALERAVELAQQSYNVASDAYSTADEEYDRQEEIYKTQKDNAKDDLEYALESYDIVKGEDEAGTGGSANNTILQAELTYRLAVKALDEVKVYAPTSGTISAKAVSQSEMASPQTAAYVISGAGGQVVSFNVSEDAANALSVGDTVTVIYSGKEFPAQLIEISHTANSSTGLYPAKAKPLSDLGTSNTGTAVKVRASTANASGALTIPLDLVNYDGNQAYIYVYKDGAAVRTDLQTGMSTAESIVITGGLSSEDYIITTWHPDLKDGVSVHSTELEGEAVPEEALTEETPTTPEAEGANAKAQGSPTGGAGAPREGK